MPTYRDDAIVLRTHKLGEADRIVTLLCRRNGRVRAVAKGVRRTSSRFGARLEPAHWVDVQCHIGRSLDIVTQAEGIRPFGALLSVDYGRWTAAQVMLETAERLTPEEREPATQQFLLLAGGLRALVAGDHDQGLTLDSYLLRSMAVAGWSPTFDQCALCGEAGPHGAVNIPSGGVVCTDCRPPGSATPASETIVLLGALLSGDWAVADASDPRPRGEASGLVAAHLRWHMERGLRSLPLVERT